MDIPEYDGNFFVLTFEKIATKRRFFVYSVDKLTSFSCWLLLPLYNSTLSFYAIYANSRVSL